MNKYLLTLYFIINPRWWTMNYRYSKEWDEKLNQLLDDYKIKDTGYSIAVLNGVKTWIANYPYAYGTPISNSPISLSNDLRTSIRPSRYTIYRLRQRVKIDKMSVQEARNYKLSQIL